MHIGIVACLTPVSGGAHQYSLAMIEAIGRLAKHSQNGNIYSLFVRREERKFLPSLSHHGWNRVVVDASLSEHFVARIKSWVGEGVLREALGRVRRQLAKRRYRLPNQVRRGSELGTRLRQHGIDWVLYTDPNSDSFESGMPFVMPVFDLQHLVQPEFHEVSSEWDEREYVFRNGIREATFILADSEIGKEDILEYYGPFGATSDRVKVLPYVPAPYLSTDVSPEERARVRAHYALPERYLFYPAQLWPHKNHVRLVQAIGLLKSENQHDVHLVLCGTHSGAIRTQVYEQVMREAHRLQVAEHVHYLSYVPNEDISALYAEAEGLVMPTFFGPTNIPIIEAWLFGCPVLTSDIRGIREQVGDAGLLIDPRSVEAIAVGMSRLWNEARLREELAQRGRQRMARHTAGNFYTQLADIIVEASQRVAELQAGRSQLLTAERSLQKAAS